MSHSFNIFFKLTLDKSQLARIEIIHQKIFKKSRKKSGLIKWMYDCWLMHVHFSLDSFYNFFEILVFRTNITFFLI